MKILKKWMLLTTVFTLVGCSTPTNTSASRPSSTQAANIPSTSESDVAIVYFSATGNTEEIAEMIADETDGQLVALQPKQAYTSEDLNYNDENSRVSQEHDDESLRNVELVSTTIDNWDSITTVYLGYPIWWGIAAWPINDFVENNDFTGKTVIPFCTSVSSGVGNSATLLYELTNSGDWKEGTRFSRSTTQEEIQTWITSMQ